MFKPKKSDENTIEEIEEELKDALVEEKEVKEAIEVEKTKDVKEEVKEQSSPQLTVQEVVNMIEGHMLRANQLLQLLK